VEGERKQKQREILVEILADADRSGALTMREIADLCADDEITASISLQDLIESRSKKGRVPATANLRRLLKEHRMAKGWNRMTVARAANVSHDFVKVAETRPQKTLDGAQLLRVMQVVGLHEFPAEDTAPQEDLPWTPPSHTFTRHPGDLGRRFLRIRNHKKLSRSHVAAFCGVSTTHLRDLELESWSQYNGVHIARLATCFEVSPLSKMGATLRSCGFTHVDGGAVSLVDWDNVGLGEDSDVSIAERLGLRTRAVWSARKKRGIPPYSGPRRTGKSRHSQMREQLEEAIFEQLGDPPLLAEGETDWSRIPYSQLPSTLLAKWTGVSKDFVRYQRTKFNARAWRNRSLIAWSRLPLGQIPDTHVAAMTGLTTANIVQHRREHNIPSCPSSKRTGMLPSRIPAREFVVRVHSVQYERKPPAPRAASVTDAKSLWDVADAAMKLLDSVSAIEVDELLKRAGAKINKGTRTEALALFNDLRWHRDADTWRRSKPLTNVEPLAPTAPPSPLDFIEGLTSLRDLSKRMQLPVRVVRKAVAELVAEGALQHVTTTNSSLYFKPNTEQKQDLTP